MNINEIVNWLRDPVNNIPDTADIMVLNDYRPKIADFFKLREDNDLIDLAINEFVKLPRHFKRKTSGNIIADHSRIMNFEWIARGKRLGRSNWNRLYNFIEKYKSRNPESLLNLDDESENILKYLADPMLEFQDIRGLVVGHIQSGKTANMTALMAKAADSGYKIFIVLAGVLDSLRQQTQLRFHQELTGGDGRVWKENWKDLDRVQIPTPRRPPFWISLTNADPTTPKFGDFKKPESLEPSILQGENYYLFVIKKTPRRINYLIDYFEEVRNKFSDHPLIKLPTMIIDDEADQATISARKDDVIAATNSSIRRLLSIFSCKTYVGYTATPFANLLINPLHQDDSGRSDVFPKDFIYSIKTASEYLGTKELFGISQNLEPDTESLGLPIFVEISRQEAYAQIKNTDGTMPLNEVLKNAIKNYILSSALMEWRGMEKEDMSMLIHPSHLTSRHDYYLNPITDYLNKLKSIGSSEELFEKEFSLLFDILKNRSNEFQLQLPLFKTNFSYPVDVKCLIPKLKNILNLIEIKILHSGTSDTLNFLDKSCPKRYIIVGGNKLSRGLTIEGLLVSYFLRNSRQYDTLLQMGRWFGYRSKYVDLTHMYMTEEVRSNFAELAFVEVDLRNQFKKFDINSGIKIRPIDMPPRILRLPSMMVTASTKMGAGQVTEKDYSGFFLEQRKYNFDNPGALQCQVDNVIKLLQGLDTPLSAREVDGEGQREGTFLWSKQLDLSIIGEVFDIFTFESVDHKLFFDYLNKNLSHCKWQLLVGGKSTGGRPFKANDGWISGITTVQRSVKFAFKNRFSIIRSNTDVNLARKYINANSKTINGIHGYIIIYFMNSAPESLWGSENQRYNPNYLKDIPDCLVSCSIMMPEKEDGLIFDRISIPSLTEDELAAFDVEPDNEDDI